MSCQVCAVEALRLYSGCYSLERQIHIIDVPMGLDLDRAAMLLYTGTFSQQNPWTQPRWLTAVPGLAAGCGNFTLCLIYFRHVFWPV